MDDRYAKALIDSHIKQLKEQNSRLKEIVKSLQQLNARLDNYLNKETQNEDS